MITCPACGKENEDSALDCKRCRAPLREEAEEHSAPPPDAAVEPEPSSESLGLVCRRCEAYNEPGVRVCTACGYQLFADALAEAAEEAPPTEASADTIPPQATAADEEAAQESTPPDGTPSLSDELSALAISDQEAAEAGMNTGSEPPLDRTPPQAFAPPEPEPAPRTPPPPVKAAEPAAAAEKICSSCSASNPLSAKFCFDCGTPFAKKAPAPEPKPPPPEAPRAAPPPPPAPKARMDEPPPSIQVDASIHVDPSLEAAHESSESTAESAPVTDEAPPEEAVAAGEPLPEEAAADAGEPLPEDSPDEAVTAESPPDESPPPFQASLIVEKGASQGTAFLLAHIENRIGGSGAHVELAEDPFVAPHAATLVFAEDHLAVRDEGSANGVFLKVREPVTLEAGDHFVAGERLFRYDGPVELAKNGEGDTPFLGAPRPQGSAVRVCEVLGAGKLGRTCHRAGPAIAIGRTGCDMNFPSDSLLAARHAEVRIGDDGAATLVDLGQGPSGVFLRVRSQGQQDLQAGDVLQIGDQQLRIEMG